jgi:hypothetical protein
MTAPNLVFVPQISGTAASKWMPFDEIPEEIKTQTEEVYEALKTNPGRMHVVFDTKADLLTYIRQVNSYCEARPAGPIHFRKSPVRNQPENEMDFRITDVPTKNAKDSAGINDAAAEVAKATKATKAVK